MEEWKKIFSKRLRVQRKGSITGSYNLFATKEFRSNNNGNICMHTSAKQFNK